MKLDEIEDRIVHHVVLYGDFKTGKSTLTGKLAEKYKLLWISVDNGYGVLKKLPAEYRANIEVIPIMENPDVPVAFNTINKLFECKPTKVCRVHGVVDCSVCRAAKQPLDEYNLGALDTKTIVVIDHMTQVSESLMRQIKLNDKDPKPTFNDYGSQGMSLSKLLTRMQHAPFHIVAIAQSLEVAMEDNTKKLVPAIGTRNFAATSGNFFDSVAYIEVKNKAHKAGSASTYSMTAATGSRDDIAIENLAELSLLPFFDQERLQKIAAEKKAADVKVAGTVVDAAKKLVPAAKPAVAPVVVQPDKPAEQPKPAAVAVSPGIVATIPAIAPAPAPTVPAAASTAATTAKDLLAKLKAK